jgi:hypothetical protein
VAAALSVVDEIRSDADLRDVMVLVACRDEPGDEVRGQLEGVAKLLVTSENPNYHAAIAEAASLSG